MLEKGGMTDSNQPAWAKVKLKKTPFSNKFLVAGSDLTNGRADCESEDSYCRDEEEEARKDCEEFVERVQVSTSQEIKLRNNHDVKATDVIIKRMTEPVSEVIIQKCDNHVTRIETTPLTSIVHDSEGYSSMESSLSAKTHLQKSSRACCSHCGRSQDEWTPVTSSEPSPLSSVESEDGKINKPVVVDLISKSDNCKNCPSAEKNFLQMVTVRVVDKSSNCHDNLNLTVNQVSASNGFHSDEDNASKTDDSVSAVVKEDTELKNAREILFKTQPQRPNGNYVHLEGCEEKADDDKNKGLQSISDKKPIWKNVKNVCKLKGITHLSGNQPCESKKGSLTRTVQKTKDGRHVLTTTFTQPDKARRLLNAHSN